MKGKRQMEMRRTKRKNKKKKKWFIGIITFLLVVLLAIGGYALYLYQGAKKLVNEDMHNPVDAIDTTVTKEKLRKTEKINILLLGIDSEEDQFGRSDAIMVMQLNPVDNEMKIVSIPRDTRTEIIDRGIEDKINHALDFGVKVCGDPSLLKVEIVPVDSFNDK